MALSDQAGTTINALAQGRIATIERKVLKEILLHTGGSLISRGRVKKIKITI